MGLRSGAIGLLAQITPALPLASPGIQLVALHRGVMILERGRELMGPVVLRDEVEVLRLGRVQGGVDRLLAGVRDRADGQAPHRVSIVIVLLTEILATEIPV